MSPRDADMDQQTMTVTNDTRTKRISQYGKYLGICIELKMHISISVNDMQYHNFAIQSHASVKRLEKVTDTLYHRAWKVSHSRVWQRLFCYMLSTQARLRAVKTTDLSNAVSAMLKMSWHHPAEYEIYQGLQQWSKKSVGIPCSPILMVSPQTAVQSQSGSSQALWWLACITRCADESIYHRYMYICNFGNWTISWWILHKLNVVNSLQERGLLQCRTWNQCHGHGDNCESSQIATSPFLIAVFELDGS